MAKKVKKYQCDKCKIEFTLVYPGKNGWYCNACKGMVE